MVKEFRCIVFSDHEAIMAVVQRKRRARENLPVGTVHSIDYSYSHAAGTTSTLLIVDDHGHHHHVVVKQAELVASLLWYCMDRRIMIPRCLEKWVEVIEGGEVTLFLSFESGIPKTEARSLLKLQKS